MFDTLGVIALLLFATLGTWLAIRSWRARHRGVRWVGSVLSSLVTVVLVLAMGVSLLGFYRINFPRYKASVADVKVVVTPEQLARGAKLATMCAGCHSPNGKLPLVGRNFMDEGA